MAETEHVVVLTVKKIVDVVDVYVRNRKYTDTARTRLNLSYLCHGICRS